jgi:hypothetical protein
VSACLGMWSWQTEIFDHIRLVGGGGGYTSLVGRVWSEDETDTKLGQLQAGNLFPSSSLGLFLYVIIIEVQANCASPVSRRLTANWT